MKAICPALLFSFATLGSGPGSGTLRAGCLDVAGSYGPDGDADSDGDAADDAGDGGAEVSVTWVTDGDVEADGAVSAGATSSLLALQAASPTARASVSPVAIVLRLRSGMNVPLKHVTASRN